MHVTVVGAGYVGLVTAACLAHFGNHVTCIDADAARVVRLRAGDLPIHEPGLDELVAAGVAAGRLVFTDDPGASAGSTLTIVAVGTLDSDGEWYGGNVTRAVDGLVRDRRTPRAIVVRSTILPGTAAAIARDAHAVDPSVRIAFNPEFTREGSAVRDFLAPDRVVLGLDAEASGGPLEADLRRLYAPIDAPLFVTDLTSAELAKVGANVFLAMKVTFANELARIAASAGADVNAVVDALGLDKRIGRAFLSPGPGYGGSCFPSQVRALPELASRLGVEAPLMRAIDRSNTTQAAWIVDRLEAAAGPIAGRTVALLGLTFKAGTDDLRESPALRVAAVLAERGATIAAWDPVATQTGIARLAALGIAARAAGSAEDACAGADAVVTATEWPEIGALDWAAIAPTMPGRTIADARRVVDVAGAVAAGYRVVAMGVIPRD